MPRFSTTLSRFLDRFCTANMATLSQPATNLQPPGDEDMEISSNYGRVDDDIDIDIDFSGDPHYGHDDDYMVDDASLERHSAAMQDDFMVDEDAAVLEGEDGVMRDDVTQPDEHLTDASEIGDTDETLLDPTASHRTSLQEQPHHQHNSTLHTVEQNSQDTLAQMVNTEHQDTATAVQSDKSGIPKVEIEKNDDQIAGVPKNVDSSTSIGNVAQNATQNDVTDEEQSPDTKESIGFETNAVADEKATIPAIESAPSQNEPEPSQHRSITTATVDDLQPQQIEYPIEPELKPADITQSNDLAEKTAALTRTASHSESSDNFDNASAKPDESTALYPCIVVYQRDEICLFPPSDDESSDTFFLNDESLAFQSIGDLLRACRVVLGDTISLEDELELNVHGLGLIISEDSAHAFTTTFAQVLQVYTQLHRIDGIDKPEPLYVQLATKTRFSTRLARLNEAVSSGKGMSQLEFFEHSGHGADQQKLNTQGDEEHHRSSNQTEQRPQSPTDPDSRDENGNGNGNGNENPFTNITNAPSSEDQKASEVSEGDSPGSEEGSGGSDAQPNDERPASDDNEAFDQEKYAEQVQEFDELANSDIENDEEFGEGEDFIDYGDEEEETKIRREQNESTHEDGDDTRAQDESDKGSVRSEESSTLQGDVAGTGKNSLSDDALNRYAENEVEGEVTLDSNVVAANEGSAVAILDGAAGLDFDAGGLAHPEQDPTEDSHDFNDTENYIDESDLHDPELVDASEILISNIATEAQSLDDQDVDGTAQSNIALEHDPELDGEAFGEDENNLEEFLSLEHDPELDKDTEYQIDDRTDSQQFTADLDSVDYEDDAQPHPQGLSPSSKSKRSHAEYEVDSTSMANEQGQHISFYTTTTYANNIFIDTKRVKST